MYKGFDPTTATSNGMKFFVPKLHVSGIDFLSGDRTIPNLVGDMYEEGDRYDNVVFDEISDWMEELGYVLIKDAWFYMNGIAMSVEICLDHFARLAENRLYDPNVTMVPSGGFGVEENQLKPGGAQISLVSSAGMDIMKEALVLGNGGTIFLQDGLENGHSGNEHSEQQTCEYVELGGKQGAGQWFCSQQPHSVHEVYESVEDAEAALQGLFFIINSSMPEIHLFRTLDIIGSVDAAGDVNSTSGGIFDATTGNLTAGDMNATSYEGDNVMPENHTASDVNTTFDEDVASATNATFDETYTASDDVSVKSTGEASSAGTRILKYQVVTFVFMVAYLF
jgi:hypothetical protein